MPTSNHITIDLDKGTGNTPLSISASSNTGREPRTAMFSAKGTGTFDGIQSTNNLIVTQSGAAEFLSIVTSSSITNFPATGGTLTYTGTSNMASIAMGTGTLDECLDHATINSVTVTKEQLQNGYTVPNNAGKYEAYPVEFVFTIPANEGGSAATYSGTIGGNTYVIVQSANASQTLSFSTTSASVDSDGNITGGSVSVIAPSELSWEITQIS